MARSNTGSTSNWLSSAVAAVTANPVTISCWFNPANLTATMNLVVVGDSSAGASYHALVFDGANAYGLGDNLVLFDVNGSIAQAATSPSAVGSTNTWHHACGVAASNTSRIAYLNGVAGTLKTGSLTPSSYAQTNIGAYRVGSTTYSPINGLAAEVGIWNIDLTAEEAASLAKGVSPLLIRPRNLTRYWPLYGQGNEICRVSGLQLTVNGTMAAAAHSPVIMPRPALVGFPAAAGAGGQTITGALFSNSSTFYGATVVPGAVTVTGGLFSNPATFYGATVSPGSVTISGARHDNSNSFFGATASASYTIQGTLYSDADSFYQATVAPGAVTVTGSLFTNAGSFYGATVAASYAVQGALYTNAAQFFGATVIPGTATISGALFSNSSTFYGASFSQSGAPQTIDAVRFDNSPAFHAATVVPGSVTISGALYENAATFYGGIFSVSGGPQTILAARFDNAGAFYGATVLRGTVTISGALYSDVDIFYGATVVPTYGIVGSLVVNSNGFFGATVAASNVIAAARYDNAPVFFSATVSAPQDQVIVGGFYANDNTFFAANFPGAAPPPPARIMRVPAEDKTLIADATGRSLSVTPRARAA